MTTTQIATAHDRRRMQVHPAEIRPGDLMRDLGRLREVERVETLTGGITPTLYLVYFTDHLSELGSLGIRDAAQVTVWRTTTC